MMPTKKIRVLEMIDDASIGGGQVHVLMLAKYLDREKFEVSIACNGQGFLVDEARKLGIDTISVSLENRVTLKSFREVTRIFRRGNFDILHTHGGTAGFWGRICTLVAGRPIVRIHSYHGMHYLSKNYAFPRHLRMIDQLLLCLTDKVICVCASDYKKGLGAGIVKKGKGVIIQNGIEIEKFQHFKRRKSLRAEYGLDESAIVFGNVGRLHVQKGHRYLLEAFQAVKGKYPNVHVWIIGEGELLPELIKLAHDLGIHGSVQFLGARTDIPDILSAIDIFVLPSLWEGQPISIMEAGAAGKPVIATNVDGIADILTDGENTLFVPAKDLNSLAAAMMRMIEDSELRNHLSASIKATVSDGFTVEKMAKKMGDLYHEIVFGSSGKSVGKNEP
ncbi:MAG: glycosyltransferase family 4 protein [Planctomycetia bacterium]|nr:glycosyltransferase family 4 protein [Planctomycetia bacterium]